MQPDPATGRAAVEAELPRQEILAYRTLGLLAAAAIVALGVLRRVVETGPVDPLWERIGVGIAILAVVAISFVYRKPGFIRLVYGVFYLVTFWVVHLLVLNDLSVNYAMSMFIVVAGISSAFKTRRGLRWYLGITVTAVAVATLAVDQPDRSPMSGILYLTDLTLVCLLLYVTTSSRLKTESELARSEERYALAAEGSKDGLWDWLLDSGEIYYSDRWKGMLGFAPDEIAPDPDEWFDRVNPDDRPVLQAEIAEAQNGPEDHFEVEYRMEHRSGETRWMLGRGVAVRSEDGSVHRMAGSQTDITARKRAEEQLVYDAFHDGLTDLPNRALFLDRLDRLLRRRDRSSQSLFGILFVDLDRFKLVNDSLGHVAGDRLLVEISRRLTTVLRDEDTVARLSGDEFGMILVELESPAEAIRVAERIQVELDKPLELEGREILTTASIGICLSTGEYERAEELLRDADIAMYRAKESGPGGYAIFDREMHRDVVRRLDLERDLVRALEREEFFVRYEPIVDVRSGRVQSFEALVRWRHPERGILPPDTFIPLAEETGLIEELGAWVLRRACLDASAWRKAGGRSAPPSVNVNLSGIQFRKGDLIARIQDSLADSGLAPHRLKLEITESVIMADPTTASGILTRLQEQGVGAIIDDFGTGYSSLSYLQRFPVETLKIDRTFVRRLDQASAELELVRAVVSLARSLNLRSVAEGVERAPQLESLRELRCDLAQGYLFARDLTADQANGFAGSAVEGA